MKVYRISNCIYIEDMSGTGASMYSGRWHNKGTYVLYTAGSGSLSMLESLAHITSVVKLNLCLICLEVPENSVQVIEPEQLPEGWHQNPSPDYLKKTGDDFVKQNKFLCLAVPSALLPEEKNFLINPAHPDFKKIKVVYRREITFDNRLLHHG